MSDIIETERLSLVPMSAEFLAASLADQLDRAERLLAVKLPHEWRHEGNWLTLRHDQIVRNPQWAPWLTRLSVLRATREVIGVIGYHGPPGGSWLANVAPDGVEFGYTTYAPWRRQGFAYESARALIAWGRQRNVEAFILSISRDNHASRGLAEKLGFAHVGQWRHPGRGVEDVFRLRAAAGGTDGAVGDAAATRADGSPTTSSN